MRLKITHPDITCDINSKDKYAFIIGASGVGKSFVIDQILEVLASKRGCIDSDGELIPVVTDVLVRDIPKHAQESPGCIFVVDEEYAVATLKASNGLNCCVFAVVREAPTYINHSYRSVFIANRDSSGRTVITRKYVDLPKPDRCVFDTLLTEDTSAGYQFFVKHVGGNVLPCGGRDRIWRYISPKLIGPNIALALDGGGLCDALHRIGESMVRLSSVGYHFALYVPESFEEILLGASFIDFKEDVLQVFRYSDNNTESLCERLMHDKTQGTPYAYDHDRGGFQTGCWLKDCSVDCPQCDMRVTTDKKLAVFQDNKYRNLLNLQPSHKDVESGNYSLISAIYWCTKNPYKWLKIPILAQDITHLCLRYNKQYLLHHADVFIYCYVTKVADSYYADLSLVQNGIMHYIPRGKSYASFKDAPVINIL